MNRRSQVNSVDVRRNAGEAGFALIELLLALLILALVGMTLQPLVRDKGFDRTVEASLRELSNELRAARLEAIRLNRERVVSVDVPQRFVEQPGTNIRRTLPAGIEIDATVATVNASGGKAAFRFFPDGSTSGGSIRLRKGRESGRLTLDWLSGHVHIDSREKL